MDVCVLRIHELSRHLPDHNVVAATGRGTEIASKFQGMFVTVDPKRDDPATLKEFLANFSPNFIGVTGSDATIRSLASTAHVGYNRIASTTSELEYLIYHQGHIVLFSPESECFGFIKPDHNVNQLVRLFLHLEQLSRKQAEAA